MQVVVLYGTPRRGTTWRLTQLFLQNLRGAEVTQFCFPRDMDAFCTGCAQCIADANAVCPHGAQMEPIVGALRAADVIVAASPVYVMGMTAGLKAFFEHLAHAWLVHRPDPSMCRKTAVCISTAAGPCTGGTLKALKQQFFYWGIPKTFSWGEAVGGGWEYMKPERKMALERRAASLAAQVAGRVGRVRPGLKLRAIFAGMAFMERHGLSPTAVEHDYWVSQGWIQGGRPWDTD